MKGIYFKHGAYYRVVQNVWYRIGTSLDNFDFSRCPDDMGEHRNRIIEYSYKVLTTARQNAKKRRALSFELDRDDMRRMLSQSNWCCAVTGMQFSLDVVAGRKPYAPSIDRMDCAQGYIPSNCRVVCLAVNYAMNVWGEDVFKRMMTGYFEKSLRLSKNTG